MTGPSISSPHRPGRQADRHRRAVLQDPGHVEDDSRAITYSSSLELDMSTVEPSLAGPRRPQDRIALSAMATQWRSDLTNLFGKNGDPRHRPSLAGRTRARRPVEAGSLKAKTGVEVEVEGETFLLTDGDVVIAAITSCTNTSNPDVMIGAGLVARRARELGLERKPRQVLVGPRLESRHRVSDQLGPARGSRVPRISHRRLCTTCIGNSGPLSEPISRASTSGARGRLRPLREPQLRRPDLARCESQLPRLPAPWSWPMPLPAVDWDPINEPLGQDRDGRDVFLRDIWPTQEEVAGLVRSSCQPGPVRIEILRGVHRI